MNSNNNNEQQEVLLRVEHLCQYFGSNKAVDDVSFDIKKGEFVCIVGPTGCGKSTFLNLLTRLIPATEGEILLDGEPADPKKHSISFVFQEPSAFDWLTVQENIEYGLKIKHRSAEEIKTQTDKIISLLGLEDWRDVYPKDLSVSMEQRVVIGRAFAVNPDLLLMDEPYGQLDVKLRFYLEDELVNIWKKLNSTVLFVTHNIEEAVYVAERILVLTNKPTKIKAEIPVDLPRPRNLIDPKFVELRKQVTELIRWW